MQSRFGYDSRGACWTCLKHFPACCAVSERDGAVSQSSVYVNNVNNRSGDISDRFIYRSRNSGIFGRIIVRRSRSELSPIECSAQNDHEQYHQNVNQNEQGIPEVIPDLLSIKHGAVLANSMIELLAFRSFDQLLFDVLFTEQILAGVTGFHAVFKRLGAGVPTRVEAKIHAWLATFGIGADSLSWRKCVDTMHQFLGPVCIWGFWRDIERFNFLSNFSMWRLRNFIIIGVSVKNILDVARGFNFGWSFLINFGFNFDLKILHRLEAFIHLGLFVCFDLFYNLVRETLSHQVMARPHILHLLRRAQ